MTAIGQGAGRGSLPAVLFADVAGPPRHDETDRQAFDVVFPRPWQGFVKVVEVEQQVAFGAGVDAEIGEMGIARELNLNAAGRVACQVMGHDNGTAPEVRKRRCQHAAVADRHQVRDTGAARLLQQRNRSRRGWRLGRHSAWADRGVWYASRSFAFGLAFAGAGQCGVGNGGAHAGLFDGGAHGFACLCGAAVNGAGAMQELHIIAGLCRPATKKWMDCVKPAKPQALNPTSFPISASLSNT